MEAEQKKQKKRIKRDWAVVFKAYEHSGMTVKDFCQTQGMSPSLFYRRRQDIESFASQVKSSSEPTDFIRLSSTASPGPPITISLGGQVEVYIHNDCDRVLLGDIIAQLKEDSC